MDAMADASTSVDGLFIYNPGSLASIVSSSAAMAPFHHFSTPTSINTVSSHRIRLSGGVRIKGKLFCCRRRRRGRQTAAPDEEDEAATSPMKKKKAAAASSSLSRPAPWSPLMTKVRSATTSTRNDQLRIPDGTQPQGPPQRRPSSPVAHPSSPMSHRKSMLRERRRQGVTTSLP
jgi:hypothetical protein